MLTQADKNRIIRELDSRWAAIRRRSFWAGIAIVSSLAVFAVSAWFVVWIAFGSDAAHSGLTRSEVYRLSGAHGRPLSATEADLVQTAWVMEVTSLTLLLILAAPFILLLDRRESNHRRRLYIRLRELGDV